MSKLKFSNNSKLHVLFISCFFSYFQFRCCCSTAISHVGIHKHFSAEVCRDSQAEEDWEVLV